MIRESAGVQEFALHRLAPVRLEAGTLTIPHTLMPATPPDLHRVRGCGEMLKS